MALAPLSDAKHRRLRALHSRAMREKYAEFLVEGVRTVHEALTSGWKIAYLCVSQSGRAHLDSLPVGDIPVFLAGDNIFDEFSTTEHSQGIVAVVHQQESTLGFDTPGLVIALDRVSDPGNVGTIIRTADWFGVRGVLLGAGCAELYNPKTVRSTMGSLFHIPVVSHAKLSARIDESKAAGYSVWCADMGGVPVASVHRYCASAMLIVGSEAHGVDAQLRSKCDAVLGVPRLGVAESLNAAAATAALLALLRSTT